MNKFTEQKLEEFKAKAKDNVWGLVCPCGGGGLDNNNMTCAVCGGCGIHNWKTEPMEDWIKQYTNDLIEEIEKEFVEKFKKERCIPCEMDESEIKELLKTFKTNE